MYSNIYFNIFKNKKIQLNDLIFYQGKFITLPRFVLMTSKTFKELDTKHSFLTPNIIVETGKLMKPFQEKNWYWIKLGDNVILRYVGQVPRYIHKYII